MRMQHALARILMYLKIFIFVWHFCVDALSQSIPCQAWRAVRMGTWAPSRVQCVDLIYIFIYLNSNLRNRSKCSERRPNLGFVELIRANQSKTASAEFPLSKSTEIRKWSRI